MSINFIEYKQSKKISKKTFVKALMVSGVYTATFICSIVLYIKVEFGNLSMKGGKFIQKNFDYLKII